MRITINYSFRLILNNILILEMVCLSVIFLREDIETLAHSRLYRERVFPLKTGPRKYSTCNLLTILYLKPINF